MSNLTYWLGMVVIFLLWVCGIALVWWINRIARVVDELRKKAWP